MITTSSNVISDVSNTDSMDRKDANMYALVFMYMLDAFSDLNDTISEKATQLSHNAHGQDAYSNRMQALPWETIDPAKAADPNSDKAKAYIASIQAKNQRIQSIRSSYQDFLMTLRQLAQVLVAQTNTLVNSQQQSASMDSGWLDLLKQVGKDIEDKMSARR